VSEREGAAGGAGVLDVDGAVAVLPGTMLEAVRIAALAFEFEWLMVPAAKTLLGFALVELKFAPEPMATAVATIRPTRTASTLRGEAVQRDLSLFIASPLPESARRRSDRIGCTYSIGRNRAEQ
jgi:hypothetical protein